MNRRRSYWARWRTRSRARSSPLEGVTLEGATRPHFTPSLPSAEPTRTADRRTLVGLAAALTLWVACDPGEGDCCNGCGRNYYVGLGQGRLWIENIQDGGNECEIDDVPQQIPDGINTLVVVVEQLPEGGSGGPDRITVEEHAEGEAAEQTCMGLDVYTAEEFAQSSPALGTRACLVDEVTAEVACTQKSCAGGLSCSVRSY